MKCGHLLQKYLPSVTNISRQNKQISAGCFMDIHITQTQTHTKIQPCPNQHQANFPERLVKNVDR